MRRVPWVIKHRPRRVDQVVDQERAKQALVPWIKNWVAGSPPQKRGALLYGPPGVGKTSLVEAIAREFNLELVEMNASDYRRRRDVERIVGKAANKRSLTKRGIIILLDEIDGLSPREDVGGVEALIDIIRETRNPIVMTANDPWKDFLRPLRDEVIMVQFTQLSAGQTVSLLQSICDREGVDCDREALRIIAERSQGDLRAAINDLESIAEGYGIVTVAAARAYSAWREKTFDVWRTLNSIFYGKTAWMARKSVSQSEMDYHELIAWINDNIPRKYKEPEDLYRAYEALSRATLLINRAEYGRAWPLLSYVFDLMGPGVAFSKTTGKVSKERYSYPARIKLLAQLRGRREVRERVASKISYSVKASRSVVKSEVLPYLHVIFRSEDNPIEAARLALGYSLDKDEVMFLAGPNYQNVARAMEKLKRVAPKEGERKEGRPRRAGLESYFG